MANFARKVISGGPSFSPKPPLCICKDKRTSWVIADSENSRFV